VSPDVIAAVAVGLPLVGALAILALGKWPNVRDAVGIGTAGILFVLVLQLVGPIKDGLRPERPILEVLPGISLALKVEPLGLLFALVASFLWIFTALYAVGYMRGHHEKNQTRFFAFFAIAISAAMGVAFSANLFTLFAFYEMITLCTYPLVTHHGTPEARKAGRVYLGILLSTSIGFQLLAIIWTWRLAGTLDFREGGILAGTASTGALSVLLTLFVFGAGKAVIMPFHRWLPAAMVAPTPVPALLHAVAVVKVGVFTILKVSVYVVGVGLLGTLASTTWLAWVAAATFILGSLVAFTKDNLKARLAYSTISQLSYIVLGALLANEWGIIGGGMHIAMHAFGKITLFFCAGAILLASHKTNISQMDGLGRKMPFTYFAFLIGALSVIGLPPMGGAWSKWYLMLAALEAQEVLFVAVLMVSSLLNVAYLLPIPLRGFFGKPDNPVGGEGIKEAPLACLIAISISALGCLVLFFYPDPMFNLLRQIVGR